MKESKFLKCLKYINESLPTAWDEDGNKIIFNIITCKDFFQYGESMVGESHICFEDSFMREINLSVYGSDPTEKTCPLIEAKVQKVTDGEFEMLFSIGWSNGSYSKPQIFAYHILKHGNK